MYKTRKEIESYSQNDKYKFLFSILSISLFMFQKPFYFIFKNKIVATSRFPIKCYRL